MSSVAIVTDSNSGISQAEGKELGNLCNSDALLSRWKIIL